MLNHLDRAIFSKWLKPRTAPLFLIGSSIGAWRFAAVATGQPIDAIENFQTAYIHQSYQSKPSSEQISHTSAAVLDAYLNDKGILEALNHPYIRLNIMAVRSKRPVSSSKFHVQKSIKIFF
ncbi:MAG: hypothetical protein JRF25_14775 [Deltaproteobacteria bacterium]|nr:hypothetical protein [Deltaproteobacteria bacterium]